MELKCSKAAREEGSLKCAHGRNGTSVGATAHVLVCTLSADRESVRARLMNWCRVASDGPATLMKGRRSLYRSTSRTQSMHVSTPIDRTHMDVLITRALQSNRHCDRHSSMCCTRQLPLLPIRHQLRARACRVPTVGSHGRVYHRRWHRFALERCLSANRMLTKAFSHAGKMRTAARLTIFVTASL